MDNYPHRTKVFDRAFRPPHPQLSQFPGKNRPHMPRSTLRRFANRPLSPHNDNNPHTSSTNTNNDPRLSPPTAQPEHAITQLPAIRDYLLHVTAAALLDGTPAGQSRKGTPAASRPRSPLRAILVLEYDAGQVLVSPLDLARIVAELSDPEISDYDAPIIPSRHNLAVYVMPPAFPLAA